MEYAVIWLLFGVVTTVVATHKGLNGCLWFLLGVVLGPFGFILSLVVSKNQPAVEQAAMNSGTMKKCPYCAELIKAEAIKCRFCGTDLPQAETAGPPTPPPEIPGPMWFVVVDRVTEQQRKIIFTVAAEMNFHENEIAPLGERGIKIARSLATEDANALMTRLLEVGISSKKIRS